MRVMVLHFQNRKPYFLCHYCRIIFRMKITDNHLRLNFQKSFQPSHRFFQGFYSPKIFQIPHIWGWIKAVVHTNAESILKLSTCCDHLSAPWCGNHKRKRCIATGAADHIRLPLIKIHHRIVCPDADLPVMRKNAVT